MIWSYSEPSNRVVCFGPESAAEEDKASFPCWLLPASQAPPTLSVCSESRAETLRRYTMVRCLRPNGLPGTVYVDPICDTVLLFGRGRWSDVAGEIALVAAMRGQLAVVDVPDRTLLSSLARAVARRIVDRSSPPTGANLVVNCVRMSSTTSVLSGGYELESLDSFGSLDGGLWLDFRRMMQTWLEDEFYDIAAKSGLSREEFCCPSVIFRSSCFERVD